MSELRQQLQAANADYKSVKYPGDLAADLQRRRGFNPLRLFLPLVPYATVAAAAVIALVIWLRPTTPVTPEQPPTQVATGNVDNAVEQLVPAPVAMPSDVVPSIPTATMAMPTISVPSVPSIPTWSVSTDVSLEESSSIQG